MNVVYAVALVLTTMLEFVIANILFLMNVVYAVEKVFLLVGLIVILMVVTLVMKIIQKKK